MHAKHPSAAADKMMLKRGQPRLKRRTSRQVIAVTADQPIPAQHCSVALPGGLVQVDTRP